MMPAYSNSANPNSRRHSWLEELERADPESAKKLNIFISALSRRRHVYSKAKDPALAQLWLAVLEIHEKQERIEKELKALKDFKLEGKTIDSKSRDMRIDALRRRHADILDALENY